ncbi:MAG TPA: right-handed parallel beta-helix repeat-containing protein [Pyrinomonadaceae bacterium]
MTVTTDAPRPRAALSSEAESMTFDGKKLLGCCLFFLVSAPAARAATYVVNNTGNGNGNGTLRKAIASANSNPGADTIAFNVPAGSLTAGVAVFQISTQLDITDNAGTTIDGTTQTAFGGNTNSGTLGAGGTVGVDALALPAVARPEVMFVDAAGLPIGLYIAANNTTLRGIAVYGFGLGPNSDASANIFVGAVTGTLIEGCVVGTTASSFTDPLAARSPGDNIRVSGGDYGTIRDNVIGYSNGKGIQLGNGADGWTVSGNEVRGNGINNSNLDGIDVENSGNATIVGNRFWQNEAPGVDMYHSYGGNVIRNNTITGNGVGANANVETPGVRLYGTGNTVDRNVINANYGAGVMVTTANGESAANHITRNSIYDNGTVANNAGGGPSNQVGIDLQSAADNELTGGPGFVTPNDNLDGDAGGNSLLNFPVLSSAVISGPSLTLSGFAPANAYLEFFVPAADASGFGEGRTYLVTLQEGSASDLDAATGPYASPYNGANVGAEAGARRFRFNVALPAGVSAGTRLTATASVAASAGAYNTSEFSNNVTAALAPDVELRKCAVSGAACVEDTLPGVTPGSDVTYRITVRNKVASGGLPASGVTVVDIIPPGTQFKVGSLSFAPGTTTLGTLSMQATNVSLPNPDPTQPPLPPPANDPSWAYAPAGAYDPNVKFVRWRFQSGAVAPGASGTASFTVRIP